MTEEEYQRPMPRFGGRVALLTVTTTCIAGLFAWVSGQWSAKGFTYNEIMLGGFLLAFACLTGLQAKTQLAINTYWFPRSRGFAPSEGRLPHDLGELLRAYSSVLPWAISGLITIGMGIGICWIYG